MNQGTTLRTVLRVAVSLQTAICLTTSAVTDLGSKSLMVAWVIFSIACDFAVAFLTTYYNNDYTKTADKFTKAMRKAKKLAEEGDATMEDMLDVLEAERSEDDD